ncbi:MAG TPA: hypothetical protein DCF68_00710 [Cyanothece sp. UBA12306]|nr:hypothetical protein [Cyanothece sp. UBA12306]
MKLRLTTKLAIKLLTLFLINWICLIYNIAVAQETLEIDQEVEKNSAREQLLKTNQCADCDLSGQDLSGLDLRNAFLPRANLINAKLIGSDLRGAFLQEAKLCNAKLISADLRGANLNFANLTDADLTYTKLGKKEYDGEFIFKNRLAIPRNNRSLLSILVDSHRPIRDYIPSEPKNYLRTRFFHGNLQGTILNRMDSEKLFLPYANLDNITATKASFFQADLNYATLTNANLSGIFGADLNNFDLIGNLGASFVEADLNQTNFLGSDLRGANLSEAKNANLEKAYTSRATLPSGTLDLPRDLDDKYSQPNPIREPNTGKTLKQILEEIETEKITNNQCPPSLW